MNNADAIEAQAAAWLIRQEGDEWSAANDVALRQWLNADARHKAAFWRLEHGWRAADRLAATGTAAAGAQRPAAWKRYSLAASVAAAALSLTGGLHWWHSGDAVKTERVETAIGDRREVRLGDGSHLTVNTNSVLTAQIGAGHRDVELEQGEVFFDVAHDPRHPFVIRAGDRRITVLGTRFAVRRDAATVRVTVVQGRVRVEDAARPDEGAAIVTAGDVAIARGHSLLLADRSLAAVNDALSWRQGVLTFDQTMLSDAIAEFNRYNRVQMRIEGSATGRIRVGGSFRADNAAAFARLLHSAFGLAIVEKEGLIEISS